MEEFCPVLDYLASVHWAFWDIGFCFSVSTELRTLIKSFQNFDSFIFHSFSFKLRFCGLYWKLAERGREATQHWITGRELNLKPLLEDYSLCIPAARHIPWLSRQPISRGSSPFSAILMEIIQMEICVLCVVAWLKSDQCGLTFASWIHWDTDEFMVHSMAARCPGPVDA